MRVLGTARSVLLGGVLFLVGGASVAGAIASPGHLPSHRRSHGARACHHARHHHCSRTRARKRSHKHKLHTSSRPSKPNSNSPGSSEPWSGGLPPVLPGSTPGIGTPTGPVEGASPVKSPAPEAPAHVEVTAEDSEAFRFVLSRPTVPAGKVVIEFVNHGQDEHNLNAVEPTEESVAGSLPNTASNAHLSLTLDLHPGSYTLFCSLPGHEAKGMKATLVVN